MNPLPPQAYTKETLLKAYHWVQSQAPSIREMAITPDILVSLYLKASRDGDHSLERPSIQNFKSELKSLAGMMGELDGPLPTTSKTSSMGNSPPQQKTSPSLTQGSNLQVPFHENVSPLPEPSTLSNQRPSFLQGPSLSIQTPPSSPRSEPLREEDKDLSLDGRSLELVREIRRDFNLSSDGEAIRMLIQIGFSKAKILLKG